MEKENLVQALQLNFNVVYFNDGGNYSFGFKFSIGIVTCFASYFTINIILHLNDRKKNSEGILKENFV